MFDIRKCKIQLRVDLTILHKLKNMCVQYLLCSGVVGGVSVVAVATII